MSIHTGIMALHWLVPLAFNSSASMHCNQCANLVPAVLGTQDWGVTSDPGSRREVQLEQATAPKLHHATPVPCLLCAQGKDLSKMFSACTAQSESTILLEGFQQNSVRPCAFCGQNNSRYYSANGWQLHTPASSPDARCQRVQPSGPDLLHHSNRLQNNDHAGCLVRRADITHMHSARNLC
jgi:hypothetical protein